ncbi:hypothetical protein N9S00_08270 [Luminiphilus sp.]|nr:hypothetical protein [Luminiphilus sp.]
MKPYWANAPGWANWWAVGDLEGTSWYEHQPFYLGAGNGWVGGAAESERTEL